MEPLEVTSHIRDLVLLRVRRPALLRSDLGEVEGGCIPAGAPTLKSVRVKQRFSE
ncbi:hypothetical protein A2U01_0019192 [Trifolium medium]|uniref:Uncharacterized protein n=1 Tax=Trifolium medium TaxID=97028 RepID=A0A392NFT0_9FABA|nr:hypothetical protein [Trifolium medium]